MPSLTPYLWRECSMTAGFEYEDLLGAVFQPRRRMLHENTVIGPNAIGAADSEPRQANQIGTQ